MRKYWNRMFLSVLSLMTAWTANADQITEIVGDEHHFTEHGSDCLTARAYYRNNMWVVELGLNNSQTYTTLQCDLVVDSKLFEFTDKYSLTDRVKEEDPDFGEMQPTHTLTSHIWESGFLRMIIGSPSAKDVKGTEGTVCLFKLNVKEGATVDQEKEYPVNLTNIVLARNQEASEGKFISQGYYLQGTIADPTYNCYDANCRSAAIYGSLSSDKEWNNFKVGVATSPWQVDIDLTQCTMTGLGRIAPSVDEYNYKNRYNKNNLLYVKDAKQVNATTNENVIVVSEAPYTESFTLHDDGKLFYAKMDFSANKASYDRTFDKGKWSTLCLPFSISEAALTELKSKYDLTVEELISYDSAEGKLKFDTANEIVANHPYIIRTGSDCAPFKDMDFETTILRSSVKNDVEMDGAKMFGTFTPLKVDSSEETAYYGFNSSRGEFFRVGKNATLPSFRACIAIPASAGNAPSALSLAHLVETSIDSVNADNVASDVAIYNMQGQKIGTKADKKLPKGVYIIGGKKKIIK